MNLDLLMIISLTAISTVLVLSVIGLRKQTASAIEDRDAALNTANAALDAAARADQEVADIRNIHQELLKRPIQAVLSDSACLTMVREILQYMNSSIDIPIRKGPQ